MNKPTTSAPHQYGTADYWKKRSHTKQQIIDRQRAKITRLERLLTNANGVTEERLPESLATDDQLEHTREARRLDKQEGR